MKLVADTSLTSAQQRRLDKLALEDDEARVISWSVHFDGPVIVRGNGDWDVVTAEGRKVKIGRGEIIG